MEHTINDTFKNVNNIVGREHLFTVTYRVDGLLCVSILLYTYDTKKYVDEYSKTAHLLDVSHTASACSNFENGHILAQYVALCIRLSLMI